MNNKTITFIIADGKVTLEASGFTGPACEAATKAFEQALGGEVTSKTRKPEYHQFSSQSTGTSAKQGN
jgi:hypothetical protein